MASQWFYKKNGTQFGPINSKELKDLADSGKLELADLVRREDIPGWRSAAKVVGLFPPESLQSAPTPPQANGSPSSQPTRTPPQGKAASASLTPVSTHPKDDPKNSASDQPKSNSTPYIADNINKKYYAEACATVLKENETVLGMFLAFRKVEIDGLRALKEGNLEKTENGYLLLLENRIVYWKRRIMLSGIGTSGTDTYNYEDIKSVEVSIKWWVIGRIYLDVIGRERQVYEIVNSIDVAQKIIQSKVDEAKQRVEASAVMNSPVGDATSADIFEAIKKLAELRDCSILTEDEFTKKKEEMLGRL